jgi:hypothetical protein
MERRFLQIWNQPFNPFFIPFVKDRGFSEISFPFRCLGRHNVTGVGVVSSDLSAACKFESLRRAAVCF